MWPIYLRKMVFFWYAQAPNYCCFLTPRFMESQNHWLFGVARDLKYHVAPTPCHVQRHMLCFCSPHLPCRPNLTWWAMTTWIKLQFTFVCLWHFCLRIWSSCVSNKQSPLKAGYHAGHTPRSLPAICSTWTAVPPLLHTAIISNTVFFQNELFFYLFTQ